jgi:hypothetical protein
MELSKEAKRAVRLAAGVRRTNTPVVLIEGSDAAPTLKGHGWHWATRGGTYIAHPSSYMTKGWSNMVYHNSTLRVEVGEVWVARNLL